MKPETLIAIYAAVVATIVGAVQIINYFKSGVRLKLSLMPDGVVTGAGPETNERHVTILTVTNRGGKATTIEMMVIEEFPSLWARLRRRAESSYIIPNPQMKGHSPNTPQLLEPARKWIGIARPRPDVIRDARTGCFYIGVQTSHRDRPYLVRIPPR